MASLALRFVFLIEPFVGGISRSEKRRGPWEQLIWWLSVDLLHPGGVLDNE